jgi:hypothetical protein
MGQVSQLEDQQDRRDDAQHLCGSKVIENPIPQAAKVFEIINRPLESAARRRAPMSEKRMDELRRRGIERERAQRAWREESNLIWIVEDNAILDFRNPTVRPIDPKRPVAARWTASR